MYVFLLIFYLDVLGRNYLISLISDFLQCQLGDPLPGSISLHLGRDNSPYISHLAYL